MVLDGVELAAETDPQNKDELPIGEGVSMEPLIADTTDDSDGDGLTDGEEANVFGTDPSKADSDGDQLTDGEEVVFGTDPNDVDTDKDGGIDGDEVIYGGDPLDPEVHFINVSEKSFMKVVSKAFCMLLLSRLLLEVTRSQIHHRWSLARLLKHLVHTLWIGWL